MSKIRERAIGAGIAVAVAGGAFWGIAAANASSRAPADEPEAPGYVVVPREEPAPVVVPESARKPDPADAPLDIGSAVDVAYIQAFRRISGGTKLDTIASDNVPAFGRNLCSGIDDGATLAQLTKAADLLEVPRDVFRAVIATSEAYYCREHIGYNI